MNNANENDNYETKDLYEAAFLYASGCTLLGLDKSDKEFYFIFSEASFCTSLSNNYWNYSSEINAKKYADSIKCLKERLFSNRK